MSRGSEQEAAEIQEAGEVTPVGRCPFENFYLGSSADNLKDPEILQKDQGYGYERFNKSLETLVDCLQKRCFK